MTVTPFHAFEIILYSLLNLLPYAALSLLMFRDSLRFDRLRTILLIAALCAVQVLIGFCATVWFRESVGLVNIVGYLVYICFFMLAVHASAGALAFLMFLLANYASFLVTAAKFLEHLVFPALAEQSYRWSFALALFAVQLVTMPFMSVFIYREIRPALSELASRRMWRYLWVIPFTFYLTWFYVSYFATGITPADMALRPMTVVFLLLINLGALVVYCAVAKMVSESAQRLRLEQDNHALAVRNLQLAHLSERMDEARRARHDLRQHYGVLLSYADAGDFDAVRSYLEQFRQISAAQTPLCYCDNPTVNAVVVYYLDRAREAGAEISARLELPEVLSVPDAELAVLFGNLLENAVEAIERQTDGKKFLNLTARADGMLVLTLDNSFAGTVRDKNGALLSSKRAGCGLGTASVKAMVNTCGGVVKLEPQDGVFRASVLLPLDGR